VARAGKRGNLQPLFKSPQAADLLPVPAARLLGAVADAILPTYQGPRFDFTRPKGEAALLAPDSLHWRVFKNPVSLYIGGVAAVILELAEPGVRTGVWEHSGFRADPVRRLHATGHAAMVSIYGPRAAAEALIGGVVRRHATVSGTLPGGRPYAANDPELLNWVQATASYGFGEAYSRYVRALGGAAMDQLFAEARTGARLYGATASPGSRADLEVLFAAMKDRLEPSSIVAEFLHIMRTAPAMPSALRPLQRLFVRAAIDILPQWARERLDLGPALGLRPGQGALVRQLGALADRIPLAASPAVQSCARLGLPPDWLYR
jgi:uncharacterized protein (DUF2236 family)